MVNFCTTLFNICILRYKRQFSADLLRNAKPISEYAGADPGGGGEGAAAPVHFALKSEQTDKEIMPQRCLEIASQHIYNSKFSGGAPSRPSPRMSHLRRDQLRPTAECYSLGSPYSEILDPPLI